jgi:hypothetical protein
MLEYGVTKGVEDAVAELRVASVVSASGESIVIYRSCLYSTVV